jgi:hypothetical protein
MTDDASLRGDCSRCIGLCCVALAFDRGRRFAFDKAAGEPCSHLDSNHSCAIHHRLEPEGFSGCATYDCRGAGQIVTAMFAGLSWRDSPAVARQIFAAFAKLREIQIIRSIAGSDPRLASQLVLPASWTIESLAVFNLDARRRDLRERLAADTGGSGAMPFMFRAQRGHRGG